MAHKNGVINIQIAVGKKIFLTLVGSSELGTNNPKQTSKSNFKAMYHEKYLVDNVQLVTCWLAYVLVNESFGRIGYDIFKL